MDSLSESRSKDVEMYFKTVNVRAFKDATWRNNVLSVKKSLLRYPKRNKTSYECYLLIPIDLFMTLVFNVDNKKHIKDCLESSFSETINDCLSSYYCTGFYYVDIKDDHIVVRMVFSATFNKNDPDQPLSDELFVRFLQKFRNSFIDHVYGVKWSYQA